jgi:hypothetical protein
MKGQNHGLAKPFLQADPFSELASAHQAKVGVLMRVNGQPIRLPMSGGGKDDAAELASGQHFS